MDIKDIQQTVTEQRLSRYNRISNLADLVVKKIVAFIENADNWFPFDHEQTCFIIWDIEDSLEDLTVTDYPLDEDAYTNCFTPFKEFRDILSNSNPSLYELNLTAADWGMLFKHLEMRGLHPMLYTEHSFVPEKCIPDNNWRTETKICAFVDMPI